MPTSGWRRCISRNSGSTKRMSRRAPNQSSTVGSSDPAATIAIAHSSKVAAVPTPTRSVLPTARRRKKALAATISAIPAVKTNSARPRRVALDRRIPTHDTRVIARRTYSRGTSQGSAVSVPRFRARYSRGAISGCAFPPRNNASVTAAITAATPYWMTANRRVARAVRLAATEVIITQLPAAETTSATWLSPIEMLGRRSAVSISKLIGAQFSAATTARLPSATVIALLTTDRWLTNAHPMRNPVAIPNSPAMTQTINQTPLRAGPALSMIGRLAAGPGGRAAVRRNPRPPVRLLHRWAPCIRCVD